MEHMQSYCDGLASNMGNWAIRADGDLGVGGGASLTSQPPSKVKMAPHTCQAGTVIFLIVKTLKCQDTYADAYCAFISYRLHL